MPNPPIVRLVTEADADVIQRIYAPIVRDTFISFEVDPPTVEETRRRIADNLVRFPWLVCEYEGEVVGYVYATAHRVRAAYQWSVDVSAYVSPARHRSGVGRALYTSLFRILVLQGFYNAYAGVALPNAASVGLHESLGFRPVGVYENVGYKAGEWHDVGWWQLSLQERTSEQPTPPLPLAAVQTHPTWQTALTAGLPLLRL